MEPEGRPILVVDDDQAIRDSIAAALELDGYPVRLAAEALEAIEEQPPSLVVLDMVMPVLDGRAFAEQLRIRGFDPPILVISASQDPERSAKEIGASGSVAKPFDIQQLLTKVEELHVA